MTEDNDLLIEATQEAFSTLAKLLSMMRLSAYVLACYAILQGALIIIGGVERFSATSYQAALLIPQAPESWGWLLGLFGIAAFAGIKNRMYYIASAAMFFSGVWSFAFGGAFLISAAQNPDANLTAIATYGKDAVIFIIVAAANFAMAKVHTKREDFDA